MGETVHDVEPVRRLNVLLERLADPQLWYRMRLAAEQATAGFADLRAASRDYSAGREMLAAQRLREQAQLRGREAAYLLWKAAYLAEVGDGIPGQDMSRAVMPGGGSRLGRFRPAGERKPRDHT